MLTAELRDTLSLLLERKGMGEMTDKDWFALCDLYLDCDEPDEELLAYFRNCCDRIRRGLSPYVPGRFQGYRCWGVNGIVFERTAALPIRMLDSLTGYAVRNNWFSDYETLEDAEKALGRVLLAAGN